MSSAPRPCTAAGNRGKQRSGCHRTAEPAVGRGGGAAERSSLRPSCAPLLPQHPVAPTCACRPRPGFTLQSGLCFSWPAPWPSPAPRPQRPRCSQTAMGQAWGGSQGQGGPPPPPGVGVGRQLEPIVPAQVPSASLEWPSAGGAAFPPAPLPHESPNHTQAEPRQLPPPHITSQNPYS